jgi:hypothetical protein
MRRIFAPLLRVPLAKYNQDDQIKKYETKDECSTLATDDKDIQNLNPEI